MARRLRSWLTASLSCLFFLAIPSFAASRHSVFSDTVPLLSDFDGDRKLDQAQLFSNGKQKSIHVSLGNFVSKSLYFDSGVQERGRLVSDDVDSDGDTDLVWISQSYPRTFVLWLGDGRGNFAIATGREHWLHSVLNATERSRLAQDFGDKESLCVVSGVTQFAATSDSGFFHHLSSQRRALTTEPAPVSNTFPFDLRQRGPPLSF